MHGFYIPSSSFHFYWLSVLATCNYRLFSTRETFSHRYSWGFSRIVDLYIFTGVLRRLPTSIFPVALVQNTFLQIISPHRLISSLKTHFLFFAFLISFLAYAVCVIGVTKVFTVSWKNCITTNNLLHYCLADVFTYLSLQFFPSSRVWLLWKPCTRHLLRVRQRLLTLTAFLSRNKEICNELVKVKLFLYTPWRSLGTKVMAPRILNIGTIRMWEALRSIRFTSLGGLRYP